MSRPGYEVMTKRGWPGSKEPGWKVTSEGVADQKELGPRRQSGARCQRPLEAPGGVAERPHQVFL
jgi:hypothetical protein